MLFLQNDVGFEVVYVLTYFLQHFKSMNFNRATPIWKSGNQKLERLENTLGDAEFPIWA